MLVYWREGRKARKSRAVPPHPLPSPGLAVGHSVRAFEGIAGWNRQNVPYGVFRKGCFASAESWLLTRRSHHSRGGLETVDGGLHHRRSKPNYSVLFRQRGWTSTTALRGRFPSLPKTCESRKSLRRR